FAPAKLCTGSGDCSVSTFATVAVCFALNLLRSNSPGLAIEMFSSGVSAFSTSTALILAMTGSSCCWAISPARPLPVIALGVTSLASVRPVLLDQGADRLAVGRHRLALHSHIELLGDAFVVNRRGKSALS